MAGPGRELNPHPWAEYLGWDHRSVNCTSRQSYPTCLYELPLVYDVIGESCPTRAELRCMPKILDKSDGQKAAEADVSGPNIGDDHRNRPVLKKPFMEEQLVGALTQVLLTPRAQPSWR
jgi:hypothetical protein